MQVIQPRGGRWVCVCVCKCVCYGGGAGTSEQDYGGRINTSIVVWRSPWLFTAQKIGQWDTTHTDVNPNDRSCVPTQTLLDIFPSTTHTQKKSRFLTWGDETTSSWLKTETLSAENKNKKYYVELKNIYFLMHLRNREIRHQHTNSLFFFFFTFSCFSNRTFSFISKH